MRGAGALLALGALLLSQASAKKIAYKNGDTVPVYVNTVY